MLFMIIERFRNGDAVPIYRRFREHGRMEPDGVRYISSWVTEDLRLCFQVMEAESREKLEEWVERWKDLVEFEMVPVITSPEAVERIAPRL
jgi:plasmid replication initiation protein